VTGNRGLESCVHGWETFRQQNYWRRETESDGRIHAGGNAELGARVYKGFHFFENAVRFRRSNWRRCLLKLPKLQKTQGQDYEAHSDPCENYDADYLGDNLNAGKMPVRNYWAGLRDRIVDA